MKSNAATVILDVFDNSFSVQVPVHQVNTVSDQWGAHTSITCPRNQIEGDSCEGTIKKFYRSAPQILRCNCYGIVVDEGDFNPLRQKAETEADE
ncbi:hypothetical protein L1N85_19935 [Paenibacillus alkaliterrae]|uniref:hypothetical protein n=1 Tax=Paenibacillus alkaliterrae TaxID=320909 RepID=UPI001F315564|nr:hypothetical protein [Paenibacillus alkaliterrae]MCF2940665.1 hypothetical protein [Paenibacillus alkaliterrae]